MWELILISIIVLGALLYIGNHYVGKFRAGRSNSCDGAGQSTACCETCDCGLECCPDKLDRALEARGREPSRNRPMREPEAPVSEERNG